MRKNLKRTTIIKRFLSRLWTTLIIHVLFTIFIINIDGLNSSAKVSLFAFLSAMTIWITTKIPAGFVAVSLIIFIILMKAAEPELLYHSFGEEVVWLMIGAFIIGEAIKEAGLAERFSQAIIKRAKNKHFIIQALTYALCFTAFFIPSTSGRAALSMPIIKQLGNYFSAREREALAILVPVVILMSTSATVIGAGSHLIGIGFLEKTTGETISFVQWLIWGVPFTITITVLTVYAIKQLLWPTRNAKEEQINSSTVPLHIYQPMSGKEKKTMALLIAIVIGWVTESVHQYDIAFITMIGAMLFMLPRYGVISWMQGIKAVSWNLVLFVAATTALGKVLVDSGVVGWVEEEVVGVLHSFTDAPEWVIILFILIVTVTSHLYITSHTTRAIVFIPSLLLFGQTINAEPTAVVFLSLVGMNYSVTFPISSKALLLFYEDDKVAYDAGKLLKISTILMPLYIIVMLLFYFTYWKWTGLTI